MFSINVSVGYYQQWKNQVVHHVAWHFECHATGSVELSSTYLEKELFFFFFNFKISHANFSEEKLFSDHILQRNLLTSSSGNALLFQEILGCFSKCYNLLSTFHNFIKAFPSRFKTFSFIQHPCITNAEKSFTCNLHIPLPQRSTLQKYPIATPTHLS